MQVDICYLCHAEGVKIHAARKSLISEETAMGRWMQWAAGGGGEAELGIQ